MNNPYLVIFVTLFIIFLYITYNNWTIVPQIGGQAPQLYMGQIDRPPSTSEIKKNNNKYVPIVQWFNKPFKQAQKDPHFPIPPSLSPAQQLPLLIGKYGQPDVLYPKPGGVAIWTADTLKNRGFCLERITLSDYPSNYLNYRIYLPLKSTRGTLNTQQLIDDLAVLHPLISYDEIKQILELDANRDEDAMALFIPVIRLITGKLTYTKAQQLFLPILESVNPYSNNYDVHSAVHYEAELCATQRSMVINHI